jgi:PAS domain S-box-containing protein
MHVLIVDDKTENLYLLRTLLQSYGCSVEEARNGFDALNKARRSPPDLIISDLLMPVMDGYTLLRQWKADKGLQKIPFVVYTATYTEPKDERLALDLGADAFIIKPVEPEPFMSRIQDVLSKRGRGELPPSAPPEDDEVGLLEKFSEVLINKLEKKVSQLEQVNQALREEIALRQQSEAKLLEARQDWEDIFQAIGHPTIVLDPGQSIVAANKKCVEVTGKPLEELLNHKCYEVFHSNDSPFPGCPMKALIESGSLESVETEIEALGGYYMVSCRPVLDKEGKIRKVIHVAADITERRKIERELSNSENRFRRIYDEAPVMMHSIDKDLIIRNVNKKWLETLGYDRDEILGNSIESFMTPESKAALRDVMKEFWNIGEVHDVAYEYVKKDGTSLNVVLDSITWDDPSWGMVSLSVVRDVTQRQLLQKQLLQAQKMEAIGTLAGGLAHDFNNILQVALGYSELILGDDALPQRFRTDLKKINDASKLGADLVQRLLTFSRKAEVKPQPLNLNRRITDLRKYWNEPSRRWSKYSSRFPRTSPR